uniref:Gnk2-homologous domain-containing protein n=1 Tax=Fagus sylvatica TaxID=28930 RepID=A0A2N9E6Y1_FAGSY
MSDQECHNCVNTLPQMSDTLCSQAMKARIQLLGCYTHYEADNFDEPESTSTINLLHKTCGESQAMDLGGFVEMRDAAFAAMESGVVSGNGFYKSSYDSVQVMAQCEGEIYLDKCFISYTYYPGGTPGHSKPEDQEGNNNNGKATAIIVGGAAALFVGFIFFLFIKSWSKKDDD